MNQLRLSSGKTERGDNRPFKLDLYNFYNSVFRPADKYPDTLTGALSGIALNAEAVIGSHQWTGLLKSDIRLPEMSFIENMSGRGWSG